MIKVSLEYLGDFLLLPHPAFRYSSHSQIFFN